MKRQSEIKNKTNHDDDNISIMGSYLGDHFTTFTRSYLGKELENQNFCYIPGEVSYIPVEDKNGLISIKLVHFIPEIPAVAKAVRRSGHTSSFMSGINDKILKICYLR